MMRPTVSHALSFAGVLGLICLGVVLACDDSPAAQCLALPAQCPATVPSYARDIASIFSARCGSCHKRDDPSGPWPLDNHSDVSDWRKTILDDLDHCTMPPPDSGVSLPESERALLHAWLVCGAPDN